MTQLKWQYRGTDFNELPEGVIGFVYKITYTDGKMYIGKKLCISTTRLKPLKTQRKNAVRTKVAENNWRAYSGSSKLTKDAVIANKEILSLCTNQRTMTYLENKWLFCSGVIESDLFYNENISGKWWSNCLDGLYGVT